MGTEVETGSDLDSEEEADEQKDLLKADAKAKTAKVADANDSLPETIAVTGIALSQDTATLTVGGDPLTLTETVSPENASNTEVTWTSSNPEIATVDKGTVTAVAVGETTVTVSSVDGNYTAECKITVEESNPVEIKDIYICWNYSNKLSDYSFSPDIHDYSFVRADGATSYTIFVTPGKLPSLPTGETMWMQLYVDGKAVGPTPLTIKALTENKKSNFGLTTNYLPAMGETSNLTIKIGSKTSQSGSFIKIYQEYNFSVSGSQLSLNTLSAATADGTALELSPAFKKTNFTIDEYTATIPADAETIKLSATACTANTKITIGDQEQTSFSNEEITLKQFATEDSLTYKIPIKLSYTGGSTPLEANYTLALTKQNPAPIITKQPASVECEKNENTTLSVEIQEIENGDISYQWYERGSSSGTEYAKIEGADSASYTVPGMGEAGSRYYKCQITNTVDGIGYMTESDTAIVTTKLTYVNAPVIAPQPGYCRVDKQYTENLVKSEYYAGETLEKFCISVTKQEKGTELSADWYYSTDGSTNPETAVRLNAAETSSDGWMYYGYQRYKTYVFSDIFEAGTYYIFCVVTATDSTNPENYEQTVSEAYKVTYKEVDLDVLEGSGTAEDPYQLKTTQDLVYLQQWVNKDGRSFENIYFKMVNDITLPEDWEPIGCTKDGTPKPNYGLNFNVFKGVFDGGGHTLTVPKGGLPLFGCVWNTTVQNLNIYGEEIAGCGLVNNLIGVGMSGDAVTIDNVKLLSGTKTLKSGLVSDVFGLNGYAACSAGFLVTIRNCTVEEGVVIGYTGTESKIGSLAGIFQGTIENCVSYATVQGKDYVGGLVGTQDNAVAKKCEITNSQFHGSVSASGKFAGGIMGGGYCVNDSAPNGKKPDISGCKVTGTVTGKKCVGGITGGDEYTVQTWDNVPSKVSGNNFTGKVSGEEYVGGIIGYYNSMNRYDTVENNSFSKDCGTDQQIGFLHYLDTSYEDPTLMEGTILVNTGDPDGERPEVFITGQVPQYYMTWKPNHNRTDDPLAKTTTDPGTEKTCYDIAVSGTYKTEYTIGDELDLSGIKLTAFWTDDTTTTIPLADVEVSGYDPNTEGIQTITLTYGSVSKRITVTVAPEKVEITVNVSILGDYEHDEKDGVHGLSKGGLETWASEKNFKAYANETVWDVLQRLFEQEGMTVDADDNNAYGTVYIRSINGIGEFTNGTMSGWMYTVNGKHPDVGVAATFVKQGDVIILHYTDDYTLEEGSMASEDKKAAMAVEDKIDAIGDVTLDSEKAIKDARDAYNALTADQKDLVENLTKLTDAEAKLQALKEAKADKDKGNTGNTGSNGGSGSGSSGSSGKGSGKSGSSSKASKTTSAKTADTTVIWLPAMLLCMAAAGIGVCMTDVRRRKNGSK